MKAKQVWLIGKAMDAQPGGAWEFQGIVENQADAVAACAGHPDWFIGPAILNEVLPESSSIWRGCYYPDVETQAEADARNGVSE